MKRLPCVVLLSLSLAPFASADLVVDASERGWVSSFLSNNGALPSNNYVAGNGAYRDWFEFAIPTLTDPLVSATLNLDEPDIGSVYLGHYGGSLTYTVYGLDTQPLVFGDVTTNNPFGSVGTSTADDGTTIHITLNAAALAAITADQGGDIFIGGIDSGENSSTYDVDFADTSQSYVTSLTLTIDPPLVPEPTSMCLFATVVVASALLMKRKGGFRLR